MRFLVHTSYRNLNISLTIKQDRYFENFILLYRKCEEVTGRYCAILSQGSCQYFYSSYANWVRDASSLSCYPIWNGVYGARSQLLVRVSTVAMSQRHQYRISRLFQTELEMFSWVSRILEGLRNTISSSYGRRYLEILASCIWHLFCFFSFFFLVFGI